MSSGLSLALLNDYIAPSQECIKPVETLKPEVSTGAREIRLEDYGLGSLAGPNGAGKPLNGPIPMEIEGSGSSSAAGFVSQSAVPAASSSEPATISLADCLACSGCITTAESVLVSLQSHHDIDAALRANERAVAEDKADPYAHGYKKIVVTISPQSRASIANKYGLSSKEVHARLVWWLRRMGVHEIWDVGRARSWALEEIGLEFLERWSQANGRMAIDGTMGGQDSMEVDARGSKAQDGKVVDTRHGGPLPLLASGCPGEI
jgi:iron only hydrogenase large subunit-like protein